MIGIQQFRSFEDARCDMEQWVKTFKERYDVIIGIPKKWNVYSFLHIN